MKKPDRYIQFCTNWDEVATREKIKLNYQYLSYLEHNKLTYPVPTNDCDGFRLVLGLNRYYPLRYVPIDEPIADLIIDLNKRGYVTTWCCCGHPVSTDGGQGYISFSWREIGVGKRIKLSLKLRSLCSKSEFKKELEEREPGKPELVLRWQCQDRDSRDVLLNKLKDILG